MTDALPGINVLYYGSQRHLECDFDVAPGADTRSLTLQFDGADSLRLDADGNLIVQTGAGPLQLKKPDAYQQDPAHPGAPRTPVEVAFVLDGNGQVGFRTAPYDHNQPLVIDPIIQYATYWGGVGTALPDYIGTGPYIMGMATDSNGASYIYGIDQTFQLGTIASTNKGGCPASCVSIFVMKIDPSQSGAASLVYTTLIPAIAVEDYNGSDSDLMYWEPGSPAFGYFFPRNALAVDAAGNAFFTGGTDNPDYPTTASAYETTCNLNPNDKLGFCVPAMYISELSPDGTTLVYSTVINASKPVVVSGNPNSYSIYPAFGQSLAVDNADVVYVGGYAYNGFPITNSYKCSSSPCGTAVAVELDTTKSGASGLIYAEEFFSDQPLVATDGAGNLYWAQGCQTQAAIASLGTTPVTFNGYLSTYLSPYYSCVEMMRLNSSGTPTYATYFYVTSSSQALSLLGLAADADGRAYIAGLSSDPTETTVPIVNGFLTSDTYGTAAFGYVAAFDTTQTGTSSLVYSSAIAGLSEGFQHLAGNGCGSVAISAYNDNLTLTSYPLVNPLSGSRASSAADVETYTAILNTKLSGMNSLTFASFLPPLPQVDALTLDLFGNISIDGHNISENGEAVLGQFTVTANAYQSSPTFTPGEVAFNNPLFEVVQAIPPGCLNFAPTSLNFGNWAIGSPSATQSIKLTNTSDVSLDIKSITPSPGFTESDDCSSRWM